MYADNTSGINDYLGADMTLTNIESVQFADQTITLDTASSNITSGTYRTESFTGTDGDDYFDPAGGDDIIDGGAGNDTVLIFANISHFSYLTVGGTTILYADGYSGANDYIYDTITLRNIESVQFADSKWTPSLPENTIIFGTHNSETVTGTDNNDYLDGAGGNDVINGGKGNDTLYIADYYDNFSVSTIDGLTLLKGNSYAGIYAYDEIIVAGVENIVFADTTITIDAPEISFIRGTSNSEVLNGTEGVDYIHSAGGNDYIDGLSGDDTLLLFGNSSEFTEHTILGLTRIWGSSGTYSNNVLRVSNVEKVSYEDASTTLETTSNTFIHGSYYDDVIDGSSGDDLIDPFGGSDIIYGNGGTDHVLIFDYRSNFEISLGENGTVSLKSKTLSGLFPNDTLTLKHIAYVDFIDEVVDIRTYSIIETYDSTNLIEGGESISFTFSLSQAPTSDVTLLISSEENKVNLSVSEITFTSVNWSSPQTISISLEDDDIVERSSTEKIKFTVSTEDENYQNKSPDDINLNIYDDDSSDDNSISGNVWFDTNGDGEQDASDSGQRGIKVYLDQNRNGEFDNGETYTETDKSGNYFFGNLSTGSYAVTLDLPTGFATSLPPAGKTYVTNVETQGGTKQEGLSEYYQTIVPVGASLRSDHQAYQANIDLDEFKDSSAFSKYDGSGYSVVIIDTGIDYDHPHFGPDLNGDGIGDKIVYSYDFNDNEPDASDDHGHGTHVASIAASSDEEFPGIAPGANIIAFDVFFPTSDGPRTYSSIYEKALRKVIEIADQYNIVSVNMSLGGGNNDSYTRSSINDELETLAAMGVIVVASSGNSYDEYQEQGVGSPSSTFYSWSIGATGYNSSNLWPYPQINKLIYFSQRDDDLTTLVAPGGVIPAARAGGGEVAYSGTSMASPVVAGAIAVIQQLAEEIIGARLSYDQMKQLFTNYADSIVDDVSIRGVPVTNLTFPKINIYKAAQAILEIAKPGQYLVELVQDTNPSDIDFGIVSIGSQSIDGGITGGTVFGDQIEGSSSDDQIYGGMGQDEINGSDGNDSLYGGHGRDTLVGGDGVDILSGGRGRDTFVINTLDEAGDTVTDFDVTVASGETEPDSSASDAMLMVDNGSIEDLNLELAGTENDSNSSDEDEDSENQEESQEPLGPFYGNYLVDSGQQKPFFESIFSTEARDYLEKYSFEIAYDKNFVQTPDLYEEDILISLEIV